ncbi:FAD-dependent urate hydroxylase [Quillaja saponaria]|uniref:FAD-dependent urate hydroxylase n=1 Tax=Quillaja saponaria TaxID=32244 RepID=A0AAD7PEW6_QUISA|nr:FAD-dependent urate hydroxylase [Quillaja saponaria]
MAATSTSLFLKSPCSPPSQTKPFIHRQYTNALFQSRTSRTKSVNISIIRAQSNVRKEDIVIVGAGIAGLATALSLHRLGVGSLILEQAESLRTSGTSLTLFKNGWRVLDAIGVGNQLRNQFLEIQGMMVKSEDGRVLRSFKFKDEDESQEFRAVERRVLLETFAGQLPPNAVQFSSKLAKIETSTDSETLLELVDGTRTLAKAVMGFDHQ